MWSYSVNHMLHGAVTRIGGAIKRIEGADGAKYSHSCFIILKELIQWVNKDIL